MIRSLAIGLVAASLAAAPALAQQDGTPGNPPSTATQRALDRATGAPPTPADGTPGNPPGTAASRAVDRTLGTDTSGTHKRHRTAQHRTHKGTTTKNQ